MIYIYTYIVVVLTHTIRKWRSRQPPGVCSSHSHVKPVCDPTNQSRNNRVLCCLCCLHVSGFAVSVISKSFGKMSKWTKNEWFYSCWAQFVIFHCFHFPGRYGYYLLLLLFDTKHVWKQKEKSKAPVSECVCVLTECVLGNNERIRILR